MNRNRSIAVLISGGLDSAILTSDLAKRYLRVYPIYIQGGHIWERAELDWLRRYLERIKTRSLKPLAVLSMPVGDLYRNLWSMTGKKVPGRKTTSEAVYLPGKNVLTIAKAAVYCSRKKIGKLALAPLASNPFKDASPSFFRQFEKALALGLGSPLQIVAPYLSLKKKQVMKMGFHLPLHLTFSCLNPLRRKHCGECNKCEERRRAFRSVGMTDRTKYGTSTVIARQRTK